MLYVFGIALAMNDGAWFPWLNIVAVAFMGLGALLAIRWEHVLDDCRPAPRRL